jgi:hypothetical protein
VSTWNDFGVVIGGAAGALVGLLFVAISIRAPSIAASVPLRNRAAHTLIIFGSLLLGAVLLVTPDQPQWLLGVELVVLAVVMIAALVTFDRRLEPIGVPGRVHWAARVVSPDTVTATLTGAAGVLTVAGLGWGLFLLVPSACVAIVGGLAGAWSLLTNVPD